MFCIGLNHIFFSMSFPDSSFAVLRINRDRPALFSGKPVFFHKGLDSVLNLSPKPVPAVCKNGVIVGENAGMTSLNVLYLE